MSATLSVACDDADGADDDHHNGDELGEGGQCPTEKKASLR